MRCTIPVLTLVDGFYSVNVYYDDGLYSESIENSCELEVLSADVFKTGRAPESKHGIVFVNSTWSRI